MLLCPQGAQGGEGAGSREGRYREGLTGSGAGKEPGRMVAERRHNPRPAFRGCLALGQRPQAGENQALTVASDSG